MSKYFSDKPVWMEFPFDRLQGLAGGELLFYFGDEPDAERWCQVMDGNPEIPEQKDKQAVRVTIVLVQEEPGNENKEGIHERYLTKEAVDFIKREPEGTQPPFSIHLPKGEK
jgi:hypothetical protein